jgi:hypothetical protein
LTAADFRLAALDQQQEQPVTFLTELDFNNAQKYKDLLGGWNLNMEFFIHKIFKKFFGFHFS